MKKMILLFAMLMPCALFAQEVSGTETAGGDFAIDLGTFTGIVALISAIVTQIAKLIPAVAGNRLAKIGMSCAVGIVVCMVAWALQVSPLLSVYAWWGALIYGVAAGLSGCGFYDLVKAIGELFKKDQTVSKKE